MKLAAALFGGMCVVVLLSLGMPAVVDEESYLFIARELQGELGRPYDWWRAWQPIGEVEGEETFIFAHPPLHLWWLAIVGRGTEAVGGLLRAVVALPWLAILAGAAASLFNQGTRRPWLVAGLWLLAPVTLLGLQASLMIDLPFLALTTAAVALYARAVKGGGPTLAALAGLALGAAACTKYPSLILLPLFAFHAVVVGRQRLLAPMLLSAGALFGACELLLMLRYGELHLLAVLSGAGEIARGPISGRAAGALVRLGLLASPLLLLIRPVPLVGFMAGFVVGLASLLVGAPTELGLVGGSSLGLLAGVGGGLLELAARGVARGWRGRSDGGGLELLLGLWVFAVIASVVLGHNYAGARYLLPAALPVALIAARGHSLGRSSDRLLFAALATNALFAVALAHGVDREAKAVATLAQEVDERATEEGGLGERWFMGEWTFRGEMERLGWSWLPPDEPLMPGALLAVPTNAAAATPPDEERLELITVLPSPERFPLRTMDGAAEIGYHSELLGRLPVGLSTGEWHSVNLYRVVE